MSEQRRRIASIRHHYRVDDVVATPECTYVSGVDAIGAKQHQSEGAVGIAQ